MEPISAILAAFAPAAVDAVRGLISRYVTPDTIRPTTIEDVVKLRQLDLDQFKIMQEADSSGNAYMWVESIRKMQRPAFIAFLSFGTVYGDDTCRQLLPVIGFYLFGERTMIVHFKK